MYVQVKDSNGAILYVQEISVNRTYCWSSLPFQYRDRNKVFTEIGVSIFTTGYEDLPPTYDDCFEMLCEEEA